MSILNYNISRKTPGPIDHGVYVPSVSQTSVSANNEVEKSQMSTTAGTSVTRFIYSATQCASIGIGKYAAIHGPTAAYRDFSASCVPESTVRKFCNIYHRELESRKRKLYQAKLKYESN